MLGASLTALPRSPRQPWSDAHAPHTSLPPLPHLCPPSLTCCSLLLCALLFYRCGSARLLQSTLAHSFLSEFDDDADDLPVAKPIGAAPAAAASSASSAASSKQRVTRVKQEHKEEQNEDEDDADPDADLLSANGKRAASMPGEGDDAEMDAIDEEEEDEGEEGGAEGADGDEQPEDEATAAASAAAAAASAAPVFSNATPIAALSALLHSERLQSHMAIIAHFQFGTPIPPLGTASATAAANAAAAAAGNAAASADAATHTPPPLNREREYPYIVSSNDLSFEIDGVIQSLHKYARDLYAPRYAELEQLLSNPVDYARVASAIANETDMSRITKILQSVHGIPNNVLLTISVTATTTRGKPLEGPELDKLKLVCTTIQELDKVKARIHSYIASRMSVLAPNTSAMLGTDVAARLVALAGGIKKLGEMPACNIQNLGKKGKNASGLSRISQGIHDGLIVTTKIIQDTPPSMRQRALRLLAGKVALAARLDSFSDDATAPTAAGSATIVDSRAGEDFLADIVAKIERWQEAPAARMTKALPVPLSRSKPKRGGKRYRKEKERMAITEIGKQKNRMHFGKGQARGRQSHNSGAEDAKIPERSIAYRC